MRPLLSGIGRQCLDETLPNRRGHQSAPGINSRLVPVLARDQIMQALTARLWDMKKNLTRPGNLMRLG
jgi:hypothetical protein